MARGLVTGGAGRLRAARASPVPADGRSAKVSRGYAAASYRRQRIADLLLTCHGAMPLSASVGKGLPTYFLMRVPPTLRSHPCIPAPPIYPTYRLDSAQYSTSKC